MKITEIKFNEDALMLKVLSNHAIDNSDDIMLFIDECSNIDNVYSANEADHDHVLN